MSDVTRNEMRWRILGWSTFIFFLLAVTLAVRQTLVWLSLQDVFREIENSRPEWIVVPAGASAARWFCESGADFFLFAVALLLAVIAFYRKSTGRPLGSTFILYIVISLVTGLSFTHCAAFIESQGAMATGVDYNSMWSGGLGRMGLVLLPGVVACLFRPWRDKYRQTNTP